MFRTDHLMIRRHTELPSTFCGERTVSCYLYCARQSLYYRPCFDDFRVPLHRAHGFKNTSLFERAVRCAKVNSTELPGIVPTDPLREAKSCEPTRTSDFVLFFACLSLLSSQLHMDGDAIMYFLTKRRRTSS